MSNSAIIRKVESSVNDTVISSLAQGGGCIADSRIVETSGGARYFLKQGFSNGMFGCEANGLMEIEKSGTIRTPKVIMVEDDFLLLEYLEQGAKTKGTMYEFGEEFARMHRFYGSSYGFYEDNFIGANKQLNGVSHNWQGFYFENRLLYQYKLAEKNAYADERFKVAFNALERRLPKILNGSEEKPSLLHGDLWGGNYMIGAGGHVALIDPAVYYGHREADLAMTKLFGGFTAEFYEGYQSEFPLKEGYGYRENVYLLYHVLNHLNLFGTGYLAQALNLMEYYS